MKRVIAFLMSVAICFYGNFSYAAPLADATSTLPISGGRLINPLSISVPTQIGDIKEKLLDILVGVGP